ncbi:hypothetical protein [Leifsonia sp. NPDC058230]|uniref:hypothetical protein n=1 Tax=Leifsonia sp. NPDC058230 TaxID=3346391 RepID=UPI0036DADB02
MTTTRDPRTGNAPKGRRRLAAAGSLILGAALLAGLTGCDLYAPQETLKIKEAADGVNGSVGDITVGNAVLISSNGNTANLVVTFVNGGDDSRSVQVEKGSGSPQTHSVTVPPGAPVVVGVPGSQLIIFTGLDVIPGALFPVYFTSEGETGDLLDVPVLDGALPQYADLTPAKVTEASQESDVP